MPRILFPPYNAIQIGEILQKRVAVGFNEGVFEDTVAPRIAAIAAQEHGDIRKAINLLGATGEIAARHSRNQMKKCLTQSSQRYRGN